MWYKGLICRLILGSGIVSLKLKRLNDTARLTAAHAEDIAKGLRINAGKLR